MPRTSVVKIAVEQAAFSYDKPYSYRWSEELLGEPLIGLRVVVDRKSVGRERV